MAAVGLGVPLVQHSPVKAWSVRQRAVWWGYTGPNDAFPVNSSEGLDRALDKMPKVYKQVRRPTLVSPTPSSLSAAGAPGAGVPGPASAG